MRSNNVNVSIVIPYIRPAGQRRCVTAALEHAGSVNIEIVSEEDKGRIGAPKMVNRLVEKTRYSKVMFLADDTIPQPGYMEEALKAMRTLPDGWGLVALNDGRDDGDKMATHWLADKRLLPYLDGKFFCEDYWHTYCDAELSYRCIKLGRYVLAEKAKIEHRHPQYKTGDWDADYKRIYSREWYLHDRIIFNRRFDTICRPS